MVYQNAMPVMLTASQLARRWGRSTKWVRENVIKPRALTVYGIGDRNPGICLSDIRQAEARAKVKAEPTGRARLLALLEGRDRRAQRAHDERGRFVRSAGGS
jgi:hypothetical protein